MKLVRRASQFATLLVFVLLTHAASAQSSSASVTQTVAQRNTIGAVTVAPTSGLVTGATATFSYTLHTAGAPAPTSETVQFLDGATPIGSAQSIGSLAGSNLLPYSQVDPAHGWTTTGNVPAPTINTGTGPDGSASSATQVVYPSTIAASSAMVLAVPGTSYAGLPMTLSVWAQSAAPTTLTLTLADSPAVAALQSSTCAVTSTWQRCTLTYTFPAGAGTGVSAALASVNLATQTISLWGAQVEQASTASPYVATIGTARPTAGQGGTVSFPYSLLQPGSHSISVSYAGDANFVASTSNTLTVVVSSQTPPITLSALPVTPSAYGTSVTFTAVVATPAGNPGDVPSGTVQFFDGATPLGTIAMASGSAAVTLTGLTSLTAGSHSITAVYSGDSNFTTVTSTILTYVVTKVSGVAVVTASSSRNPSTYGDSVTLSITVASPDAIPTGSVVVVDTTTSTTLGTVVLSGGGTGTLTVPLFTAGTHTITFTYSGDSNYN